MKWCIHRRPSDFAKIYDHITTANVHHTEIHPGKEQYQPCYTACPLLLE